MELIDTCKLMVSDDYKDRFRAEYYQTKIRYIDETNLVVNKHDHSFTFGQDYKLLINPMGYSDSS